MSTSPTERPALHSAASPESAAILRILVFGYWSWVVASHPLLEVAAAPAEAFSPFGLLTIVPATWWDVVMRIDVLRAISWATLIASVAAMAGLLFPVSGAVAVVGLLIGNALLHGFGHYDHAQLPILFAAIIAAASPTADALALGRPRREARPIAAYQFPLFAIGALLLLFYSAIGLHRILHGAPGVFAGDSFRGWILWNNLIAAPKLPALLPWLEHPMVARLLQIGFPLVTLLEVTAVIGLVSARYRNFFLVAMLGAHVAIYGMMAINFVAMVLLYVTLIDSRRWSPVHPSITAGAIVFYDGLCSLCDGVVGFLMARDHRRALHFAALQGTTAAARLSGESRAVDSILFLDAEGVHTRAAGVLQATAAMRGRWSWAALLGLAPRWISDPVYDWVARNRYRWFPRRDACRLPTPEERAILLP